MSKKERRFDSHSIPRRLNMLFALVIILFVTLIARLAYMQVLHQGFYTKKLATASKTKITLSSVRGQIYDASGKPLVENETKQVVSFTRSNKMTAASIKEIANKLLDFVDVTDVEVTKRQIADYYLADSGTYQEVVAKLPKKKKLDADGNRLSEAKIYNNAVDSVEVASLDYSEQEKKAIALFSQMNEVANFETGNIRTDDLSTEQVALIASSSKELPGISIATAWERKVLDTPLASIIGNVSTEKAGIPAEEVDDYLKKGYSLKDRVGTSYLEKQYESVLQGERTVKEIHLDKNGDMESIDTIKEGSKGKNLKLTVDLAFQTGVENILKNYFTAELAAGNATYSEGTYAIAMNPETGAILAMAGLKHDVKTGALSSNSLGTVTDIVVPGSVVKGATLTSGWANGAISGNQTLTDQPIIFGQDTTAITSWFTHFGNRDITALEALEYSSNTYMVQLALKMMGMTYTPNMTVNLKNLDSSMEKLRATFAEYGLGTKTGIDLPTESQGYIPKDFTFANYLTNAFGQFDNYTPLQLAQYAATVANNGKRIAPHLVEGIYGNDKNGGLGDLIEKKESKELNQVTISSENMNLIKEGFYQVVHGNNAFTTGQTIAQGEAVPISAKTGTAETFVNNGQQAINTNVVAYAPSNNPKIAVAVVFPHNTNLSSTVSHSMTRDIINLYNQLHPMN